MLAYWLGAMGTPALLEQVAMYFASLPCPPLPVYALREHAQHCDDDDEAETPIICSSHDILAQMMLHAMHKNDQASNAKRKTFQIDVTRRLLEALNVTPPPGPERTYFLFQQYTADYISAFSMQSKGVRFATLDDVPRGHAVHMSCCSWNAAQDIQHAPPPKRRTAADYAKLEFRGLIERHYERVNQLLESGTNPWLPSETVASNYRFDEEEVVVAT